MPRFLFVKAGETDTAEERATTPGTVERSAPVPLSVCEVLEIVNVGNAKDRLEGVGIRSADVWSKTAGRNYLLTIVNESGLYDVI